MEKEQAEDRRKYDEDLENPLRVCETMYYNSKYNPKYIEELRKALRETGLLPEKSEERELKLKESFKKTITKQLENNYSSKFIRYEKEHASVDILIDALASRTTNASFSYELISNNTIKKKIIGIEKEIIARIPIKELLIVTKLHSGRLTDFRDIAALAKDTDLELIKKFLFIGNLNVLNENLSKLHKVVNDRNFIDSFKGVFVEKKFDIDFEQVKKISELKG